MLDRKPRVILNKEFSVLHRHNRSYMNHHMEKHGLGAGQYTFLFFLCEHSGLSQDELSKALEIDKGATARAVAKLESNGYVIRRVDEKDKRINRVFVTDKGWEMHEYLKKYSNQFKEIMLEGFSEEEVNQLEFYIKRIINNASAYRTSHCHSEKMAKCERSKKER